MKTVWLQTILLMLLTSCSTTHFVVLQDDGTAKVITDIGLDDSFVARLKSSKEVTDLNSSDGRVSFRLNSIDSIGNFLPYHQTGYLEFRNYSDSIVVQTLANNTEVTSTDVCCNFSLRILPVDSFDAYDESGKRISAKMGHHNIGFWLSQNKRNQKLGRKKIYAILKKKTTTTSNRK
jgi:hypothetical protein